MSWRIRSLLLALFVAGCALSQAMVQPERPWRWCEPGEIGDWGAGTDATGTQVRLYLVRTALDATDADIRCQVRPTAKILVLSAGKET